MDVARPSSTPFLRRWTVAHATYRTRFPSTPAHPTNAPLHPLPPRCALLHTADGGSAAGPPVAKPAGFKVVAPSGGLPGVADAEMSDAGAASSSAAAAAHGKQQQQTKKGPWRQRKGEEEEEDDEDSGWETASDDEAAELAAEGGAAAQVRTRPCV